MRNFKKLKENRGAKVARMDEILGTADTENRAVTESESVEFESLKAEIRSIDQTIAAEVELEKTKLKNSPEGRATGSETDVGKEERAFVDLIMDVKSEERASLLQSGNGTVVPTSIYNKIIKEVSDRVPFLKLSNVITTNGKVSVPVYGEDETNYIIANYVGEGEKPKDNIGNFTTIDLTGYVLGATALVSRKFDNNTDLDIIPFVIAQIADAIAARLEDEFINGKTKISGILQATRITTAISATDLTYDELVKLKHSLKKRFRSNAAWIMSPSTYTSICALKNAIGIPYFDESKYKILGLDVIESDNMPEIEAGTKPLVIADLKGYTIKATKTVAIQILREKYSEEYMIGITAHGEYDGRIVDQKRIAVLQMAAVTRQEVHTEVPVNQEKVPPEKN